LPADKAISRSNPDGLQGEATQYVSKKTAQAVCNAYENGFSDNQESSYHIFGRFASGVGRF